MANSDIRQQIKGYEEVLREAEACRKYGRDYEAEKGLYARVLNRLHPRRLELKVSRIMEETASAKTFRMVTTGEPLPPFQAGQYINLTVRINGIQTGRAYSISSSPTQTAYYDITVRRVENGFVSDYMLDQVTIGEEFTATSPTGNFYYNPLFHGQELVFIAGGSGITPFMSMIRETLDSGLDRSLTLIYGNKSADDVIFHKELSDYARVYKNFSYHLVISDPPADFQGLSGLIDKTLISKLVPNIKEATFYLCGPTALYEYCLDHLKEIGIPQRRIRKEVMGAPANICSAPGWPSQISADTTFNIRIAGGSGPTEIIARAGETLMASLERNGYSVKNSCRSGECSLCRTKLVSGQVYHPPGVPIRQSDQRYGYIHPCIAFPLSDLELLL